MTNKFAKHGIIGVLLFALLPFASVYAGGYGVSGGASSNNAVDLTNARIEALISNAQQPVNYAGSGKANAGVDKAPVSADTPYGKDPVGEQAFASMVKNLLPLTPQQIKTLHYLFNKTRQAAAQYPGVPPKPTSTSMAVNLSPGATPPIVRLQQGYVSSLVFVDATGEPWPIAGYDLGNNKAFNIQWDKKGNTLMVQALSAYKQGNLAVMLKGLSTPIMISLATGQHAVDYRVDLRVPQMGPNANPMLSGLPQTETPQLMNVLNGIPPAKSQALVVKGPGQAQAWLIGGHVYLRTTMTLLSPAFISTMSSPDGTHAYEIEDTPVLLALLNGKTVQLTIEGL